LRKWCTEARITFNPLCIETGSREDAEARARSWKLVWGYETRAVEEGEGDARLAIKLGKKPREEEAYLIPKEKPPLETGIKRKIQEKLPLLIRGTRKLTLPSPEKVMLARDRVRKAAIKLLRK